MKYSEFAEKINDIYKAKFPRSTISIKKWHCFTNSILISLYLAGNQKECTFGYWDNDMMQIRFDVTLPGRFDFEIDELPEKISMENVMNVYKIEPENKYLAFGGRKITYRRADGTPEKIIEAFKKYVDRLYKSIIDDMAAGKIHKTYIELVKEKIA